MAWVTKANIDTKRLKLKEINKKFGMKATLSGTNSYSMKLTVTEGSINFIDNYCNHIQYNPRMFDDEKKLTINYVQENRYIQVNPYWFHEHFTDKALEYLTEIKAMMNEGNHDNSDVQTDYFDVGWYIDINIGKWDKPYKLID